MFGNTPLDAVKLTVLRSMGQSLAVNITGNTCIATGNGILQQQSITLSKVALPLVHRRPQVLVPLRLPRQFAAREQEQEEVD